MRHVHTQEAVRLKVPAPLEKPRQATTDRLSVTAVRWRCLECYVNGRQRVPVRTHTAPTPLHTTSSFWHPHPPGCCAVGNGALGFSAHLSMDIRVPASLGRLHAKLMGASVFGLCVDVGLLFSWVNTWGRVARSHASPPKKLPNRFPRGRSFPLLRVLRPQPRPSGLCNCPLAFVSPESPALASSSFLCAFFF